MNELKYSVLVYRENGLWKFKLDLPVWLVQDILLDQKQGKACVVSAYAGTILTKSGEYNRYKRIVANVKFEEIEDK